MTLTLTDYIKGVRSGALDPKTITEAYIKKIAGDNTNSFLRVHEQYIEEHTANFSTKQLAAAPIGVKDIIMTKGYETSCASHMLSGYIPPYSATCMSNLEDHGGLMIGKTNMDEFAMGASGENSAFGPTKNPVDLERVPGGSSSGSAAAVAGDLCIAALGTDTGGSVRQPASFSGVVGVKPTYGRVSRYGVQSMTSSFDQVGVFTKTVDDAALLLGSIAGNDCNDAQTSQKSDLPQGWYTSSDKSALSTMKFALPKQFMGDGLDPRVKEVCEQQIATIRQAGGVVDEIDLPILSYAVPVYYIIVPAQVSTNLARFDGIRFGKSGSMEEFDTIFDYYASLRNEGFGDEVKRRILTGTYVLSAGFYDAYYAKALAAQKKMTIEMKKVLKDYHCIIGPTAPSPAWKIGEKDDDPIAVYLADMYTCPANITGMPALSLPAGYAQEGDKNLPVGIQLMANNREESMLFTAASALSSVMDIPHA